jgi:hypothetical protein
LQHGCIESSNAGNVKVRRKFTFRDGALEALLDDPGCLLP